MERYFTNYFVSMELQTKVPCLSLLLSLLLGNRRRRAGLLAVARGGLDYGFSLD
jgi:hypothetical protein